MKTRKHYLLYLIALLFTTACSNTRKIPEGDALYTGASVKIEDSLLSARKKKGLRRELSAITRPRPNKRLLGMRVKLFAYNLAGNPKKEKSPAGWLKNKVGEPPVLLSDVNLERNINVLQSTLENRGYFKAYVYGDTSVKNKKATATYTVRPGIQYMINEIRFTGDSSRILEKTINESSVETLLKTGEPFDLSVIKGERERIDAWVKERGFFYFDPDYIIVQADSTIGNHQVNLFVKVKPSIPEESKESYRINDVYILSNYRLNSPESDTLKKDAEYYKGYYVVDKRRLYKPRMFSESMQFDPGDVYNRTDHTQTISRLINLGVFKFVKNRFEIAPGVDSPRLNAYYYLTPLPKKAIRGEIDASVKSNNLTGSSVKIGWRNRNTFRGGELFSIDATGGFEVQFSGQFRGYNTFRAGLETNFLIPRFLSPFHISTKGGYVPRTRILLGYDVLRKQKLYTMNSFRAGFGYIWKENVRVEHALNPIAVNYVQPILITQEYLDSAAKNQTLLKAVEKQFILGSNYSYTYNELVVTRPASGIYFNGTIDVSGNIAGLVTGADAKSGKPKNIFGAQFSQYLKLENDFRYYAKISPTGVWANRLILGLGFPYGNSLELPYIKQFFVGGTSSIRAFRSRSLGPGTYEAPPSTTFLPDQSGDIKIELNTELRAKLFSIVHGALFIDAGNIWLYNENPDKPGAKFSKNFLKELAVGAGVGLRFDVSFLVVRLDVAFPVRKPYLPDGQRWVMNQVRFNDAAWRRENIIFNLGIGYPF